MLLTPPIFIVPAARRYECAQRSVTCNIVTDSALLLPDNADGWTLDDLMEYVLVGDPVNMAPEGDGPSDPVPSVSSSAEKRKEITFESFGSFSAPTATDGPTILYRVWLLRNLSQMALGWYNVNLRDPRNSSRGTLTIGLLNITDFDLPVPTNIGQFGFGFGSADGDGVGSSSRATYCPKKTEVCTVMFINLDFTINYTLIAVPTTFDTKEGVGPVLLSFKPYVGAIDSAEAYPAPEVQYMWIFWFKDMSYGTYTLYISKESAKTMTPVGILINGGYSPEGLLPSIGGNDNTACNKQLQTMTALLIATSVAIAVIGLPLFIVLRIRRQRRKHSVDRIDAEEATAADDSDDMYSEGSDLVTLYALDPLQIWFIPSSIPSGTYSLYLYSECGSSLLLKWGLLHILQLASRNKDPMPSNTESSTPLNESDIVKNIDYVHYSL
ncbi:hypothetical protein FOL47_004812 [Perkinsus chesapeaki]|uniref:Uncharacterized protein n=1 Tax=Perkinsus chesapeaki TaxID=330153 RepID=A0A7J6M1I6_PERCH|nr:hypothetical protein FOL47_004812 [Perkinsus chesapeaki]